MVIVLYSSRISRITGLANGVIGISMWAYRIEKLR